MALPTVSRGQTTNVGTTHLNPAAATATGPTQRKNVLARMATASRSTLQKSRHFAGGLFKARPGDASSIPRASGAGNTTNTALAPNAAAASTTAAASAAPQANAPVPPTGPATTQLPAMAMTTRLSMALHNQQLTFGGSGQPNRTERLLEGILSKHDQRYQGLAELNQSAEKTEYLLVDTQHRLLHAHASDAAISLFKSSEKRANNAFDVAMPTDAHRAQVTGVHKDANNMAWRIHENKLYALQGGQWHENTQGATLKTLHNIGAGNLFGLNGEGLVYSLNDLNTPLNFDHKVTALGRSPDGQLMALSEDTQGQHLLVQRNALGAGVHDVHHLITPTGTDNDEALKPKSVAIAGQRLLATTASGKLLQATMPAVDDRKKTMLVTGELTLQPAPPSPALLAAFGNHTVSDFFHDDKNVLHARVKDQQGLEHSAAWDDKRQDFVPGWSMAPLVMDRQHGLPVLTPEAAAQIQLPRGKIASHDNTLLVQDPRTEEWKKTTEKDIKALQAGQDGFAYIIDKDGKLKQLKVVPQAAAHDMGRGADLALQGRGTEAKGTALRGAEHLVADKLAVQNDQNFMTLSDGELRLHDQNGERAQLPKPPGTGDIQAISTGGKDWFALRGGALFRLSGDDANARKLNPQRAWQAVQGPTTPPGAVLQDLRPHHDGRLVATTSAGEFVKTATGWEAATPAPAAPRNDHAAFNRLAAAEPETLRRGSAKLTVNVMGSNNVESMKVKQYAPATLRQNYLTAHLSLTGAAKVPADSLQHAWKGREGLRPIYTEETALLRELHTRATTATGAPGRPMAQRIDDLAPRLTSHESGELAELFNWFQTSVTEDLQKTLRELAQDEGALLKNGTVNPAFRGKPRTNDMLPQVAGVMRHSGIDNAHELGQLLDSLENAHFTLERRNTEKPLDGSRTQGDKQALLRARLALDVKVLNDISTALDGFADEVKKPGAKDFAPIATALAALHNDTYEGSPVKRYTDAGFRDHASLEASYDATKNLLKHLRKDNHPLKRNILQGLETPAGPNNADVTRSLTQALRDLEPRESVKLNRNYGGGITGGVAGPAEPAFLGFRGNIDPERTYGLTFTRFDRGLKVSMSREGAISGTGSFGFGGGKSDTKTTPGDSHANIQSNGGWFGGSLDAKYKYANSTALSFFIRDDEIDDFMADLMQTPLASSKRPTQGGLKPMELMDRGVEKEVRTTGKHAFDLDAGVNLESRTNKGQTDAEPVAGFMRFGAGLLGTVSLLSAERERTEGHGSDGLHTDIYSSNRARFLEKGSVTGYARMFSTVFTSRPSNLFVAGGAPLGVSATLAFDNKTGKSYDVRFKNALPLQTADVKTLGETLEKAFPGMSKNPSAEGKNPEQVLQDLKSKYLTATPDENDAQYAARQSLRQLDRQNTAAGQGSSLMSLMDMVVKHNNVNRLDQAAPSKRQIDRVKQMLGRDCNEGNARRIHDMMSADPQFKGLLDAMKDTKGTTRAEIKLEVRDDIKERIETGALDGSLTDAMLKDMLGDKNNLRIKSIAVFKTAAKEDSFGTPFPFVSYKSGSALSIERLMGEVTFEYGMDPTNPKKATADGDIADRGDSQPALELGQVGNGAFRPR
ncbi:AvrE-family type 3 secretion system effector [Pseudomonas sp. PS02290]|uniref:AvrE-family type 3 secretion system effector n=1 Tax=Pseudomonas sp. PS02290 TaxID=2991430 RepID=UPI00249CA583|nr:AvrE-family type 3 secretion system effector [Pseudomonas sp. PS02290]